MHGIQIYLKKFITSKFLVMVIVGMAAAFACSLSAFAVEDGPRLEPRLTLASVGDMFTINAYVPGDWNDIQWQYMTIRYNSAPTDWVTSAYHNVTHISTRYQSTWGNRLYRIYVTYSDGTHAYSNSVYVVNSNNNVEVFQFGTFANEVLDFLISSFNIVLPWCLAHPIVFVGLALSLIIAAIGTLRHIVGGSHEEKASCDIDYSY